MKLEKPLTMRTCLIVILALVLNTSVFAVNSPATKSKINVDRISSIEDGKSAIELELEALLNASSIIDSENLSYDEFSADHEALATSLNLESEVDTGIFEGSENAPVGIPGFWWGFCFGILGLVVVYVAMEDTEERKEQAKNALIGCVASTVVFSLFYIILFAAAVT